MHRVIKGILDDKSLSLSLASRKSCGLKALGVLQCIDHVSGAIQGGATACERWWNKHSLRQQITTFNRFGVPPMQIPQA
jgi:hypothetical protein